MTHECDFELLLKGEFVLCDIQVPKDKNKPVKILLSGEHDSVLIPRDIYFQMSEQELRDKIVKEIGGEYEEVD